MIKNSTKLIILCLIAGFSFSACKKSSDSKPTSSNTYSMKLTLNGKAVTYTSCLAADITANGVTQFNIIGATKGNESLTIDIIANLKTVKAGQVFKAATDYVQPNSMSMFYIDAANNNYGSQIADPTGSITITSVSSTAIKGTFSGKLYNFDDIDATELKYTITDGSFVAELPQ